MMTVVLVKGNSRWYIPESETGIIREALGKGWERVTPEPTATEPEVVAEPEPPTKPGRKPKGDANAGR